MTRPAALLDSNVLVAAVAEGHEHHSPSVALFDPASFARFCVAAHSYAEAYSTLTRLGSHAPFRRSAEDAWAALGSIAAVTMLVGLTPAQTFDALRAYAAMGGVGARLYDHLIGRAAAQANAASIITWNIGHYQSLFPDRLIETPLMYVARVGRA